MSWKSLSNRELLDNLQGGTPNEMNDLEADRLFVL